MRSQNSSHGVLAVLCLCPFPPLSLGSIYAHHDGQSAVQGFYDYSFKQPPTLYSELKSHVLSYQSGD